MQNEVNHSVTVLRLFFGVVPIVAGIDKFFNILVDWEMYVSSFAGDIVAPATLLMIVGVVEIIAGLLVFTATETGAYVVAVWLLLIAINLIIAGFYDIAVRDVTLAASAYVLAVLSGREEEVDTAAVA